MAIDIGQGNYPLLNQNQTNPIMSGLANAIALHMQMQQTQRNRATLPFAGPQAQANLQQTQLQNQGTQAQLPYVGPQAAANLQRSQLANAWFAPEQQAQIGLQRAQTQGVSQSALGQAIANQFMPQQQQADIGLKQAQTGYYGMGGPGMGVGIKDVLAVRRQVANENPDWSPQQVQDATSQYLNGSTTFSNGQPLPPPSGTISALTDITNMKTNTASGIDQSRFASTLGAAFNSANQLAPSAFKFAGVSGQAKLAADKVAAQNGNIDPDYLNYLNFTRQALPGLASEILRTGGAHATDQQKATAIQQLNPIAYDTNPALAMQEWNYLQGLYKQIGQTISQSPTKTKGQLQSGAGPTNSVPASADAMTFQEAKQKYPKLTDAQIMQVLGGA